MKRGKKNQSGIDWSSKEERAAYMRRYNEAKHPVLDHHLWDHVSDTCQRCGLKRHRSANLRRPGQFIDKYWVNKAWTLDRPDKCERKTLAP